MGLFYGLFDQSPACFSTTRRFNLSCITVISASSIAVARPIPRSEHVINTTLPNILHQNLSLKSC